jgi:hypothetical protein
MEKRTFFTSIVLLWFGSVLFAQTQTTVYGNLGVENVNISIVNTPYGTSTDAKGHYELPLYDRSETVSLYYSCIGYQDTVVSLTPRQLQRDSINVSFCMRKMSYDLQEVGVSASKDFYRSGSNRNIADIAFLDGKIYLLENQPKTSSMVVLDTEGNEQAHKNFDQLFEKLYIDAFDNLILVGQDSCLQVYLNEKQGILPVSTFSRDDYRNKLLKIVCEYNGAYIVKTIVHDRSLYWLKYNHGKSQDFYYVMKDNSEKEPHYLCSFLDTLGYLSCQSQWMSIQHEYHQVAPKENNLINEGIWDGNLVRLILNESLEMKVQWYCSFMAKKEYQIVPLIVNDILQFADLDNREIVEIGPDFKIANRQPLKITSGEQFFKNEFLTDKATGKTYGLFVDNGMSYIGLYDPEAGTVGMGQKASKKIFPRVFKVHGGYAYSVFFDSVSNRGVISRVKIE